MGENILATVSADSFVDRRHEMTTLLQHAAGESGARGLLLLSAPATGASELLKQIYDRLFSEKTGVIPIYFAVQQADKTAKNCAARFLQTFIAQTVAFRYQDKRIIDVSPDLNELAELAAPDDSYWIDRLVAASRSESRLNDERGFIKSCLGAPLRAAAYGANSFVVIDDLNEADSFSGAADFIEELKEIFSRSTVPFVLAGRRRFLLNAARTGDTKLTDAEILRVESLGFADAQQLAENLAEKYGVKINEQTRDLIARQFGGNPSLIKFTLQAAGERQTDLDSFQSVERVYAEELFGGRIGKFYDAVFEKIAPNVETRKNLVKFLHNVLSLETEPAARPLDEVYKRWQNDPVLWHQDFYRLMSLLNAYEIVRLSSNLLEPMEDNDVVNDYLTARFRLETTGENRALVVAEMMSGFLKRAPQTMAKFYRRASSIGLREILSAFNSQEAPAGLLDYSIFKDQNKEADVGENAGGEKIRLPQIIYSAPTAAFYPPLGQITENTSSAVGIGFDERDYTDAGETVWIAAEIESKLEATAAAAAFWCDRLEMVAAACDFTKYVIWLVAPEGFATEAMNILRERNAYGSSRRQVELLAKFLRSETESVENQTASEYEIITPMGEDAEMIAARAVEEIARRHFFEPKAINQIKTALVEACINAAEHSLSPDRKLYQKFTVEADKIVITIANRGLRLTDRKAEQFKPVKGRRGWGLKLMESLMDEVKFEQVDDGTRISMTKYLKK